MVYFPLIGSSGFDLHKSLSLSEHRAETERRLRSEGEVELCVLCAMTV